MCFSEDETDNEPDVLDHGVCRRLQDLKVRELRKLRTRIDALVATFDFSDASTRELETLRDVALCQLWYVEDTDITEFLTVPETPMSHLAYHVLNERTIERNIEAQRTREITERIQRDTEAKNWFLVVAGLWAPDPEGRRPVVEVLPMVEAAYGDFSAGNRSARIPATTTIT